MNKKTEDSYTLSRTQQEKKAIKRVNIPFKYCKSSDSKPIKKRTDRKFVFNFADPRSLVTNHVAFTLQSSVENKNTICST